MVFIFINITKSSLIWNTCFNLLTKDEKHKINKFNNENDRKLSLASIMLQHYVINKNIKIKKNEYGKPYVDNFEYSVSHDNDIVIILTSSSKPVGIDIMLIDRKISLESFKLIFPTKKYKNIKDFLILWCLKESYIKAIGIGLSYGLDRIEFDIEDNDNIKLYIDGIYQSNWYFNFFILKSKYIVAIAKQTKNEISKPIEIDFDVVLNRNKKLFCLD